MPATLQQVLQQVLGKIIMAWVCCMLIPVEGDGCFASVLSVGGILLQASGLLGHLDLGSHAAALQARLCDAHGELRAVLGPQLGCDDDILSSAQVVRQAKGELQRACVGAIVSSAPASCCVQARTQA